MGNIFHSIGTRLLALVSAVIVIGMYVLVMVYADRQEETIFRENEHALEKVTDSVAEGLSALMIKGPTLRLLEPIRPSRLELDDGFAAITPATAAQLKESPLGTVVFEISLRRFQR